MDTPHRSVARSGAVHDALAEASLAWNGLIADQLARAVQRRELAAAADPDQLAFELIALLEAANAMSVLHRADEPYRRAEAGVRSRLTAAGADPDALG